jgi:hypothetical protein
MMTGHSDNLQIVRIIGVRETTGISCISANRCSELTPSSCLAAGAYIGHVNDNASRVTRVLTRIGQIVFYAI